MKKLYRDRWNKKIGGVCGGIGQYLRIDPSLIRLIYVTLMVFTGLLPMIVIYLILWILMPEGPKHYVEPNYPQLFRSRKNRYLSGICGGLAQFTKIDPTVIRIAFLVICLVTGVLPVILIYIAGIFVVAEEPPK